MWERVSRWIGERAWSVRGWLPRPTRVRGDDEEPAPSEVNAGSSGGTPDNSLDNSRGDPPATFELVGPVHNRAEVHPVPPVVRAAAGWAWRFLVIALAVSVIGALAWHLRVVVFPVAAAVLLAALLAPAVQRTRDLGLNRGLAAAAVFVAFLAIVIGSLSVVGGVVGDQFGDVVERAEQGLEGIQEWLSGPPFRLSEQQLQDWIDRLVAAVGAEEGRITEGAVSTATVAFEVITGLVIALFTLLMFLYDGDRIWGWIVQLFPRAARQRVDTAGQLAWGTLTQFIRGTVLVALFDGVAITILLLILGVPLALALGVLVFFGAFVPLVGAFVTGALAVLVALVANGWLTALIILGGIIAIQQIEGNVFQPLVMSRMVRLHPLAVVLTISVGALVAGIIGAIVAVPIAAVVNTMVKSLASPGTTR